MRKRKADSFDCSIQLKPVGSACNLRCQYCYVKPFRMKKNVLMSDEVLERTVASCLRVSSRPIFTWHGGEPTLCGLPFFRMAVQFMKKYQRAGQLVENKIQTNACGITPELARFLKEEDFSVGVSLDGPEKVHGINRIDCGGKNSFSRVMNGLDILRSAGLSPSLICTVTRETLPYAEEAFLFFVDNGFTEIKYSPVFDSTTDSFSILGHEWFNYLRRVFDEWFRMENSEIAVRDLDEVIVWQKKESLSLCASNQTCLRWVSVNPGGELYPCEYFRTTHSYGNILTMELEDIPSTPAYQRFTKTFLTVPERCQGCEFHPLCGNGCPATRLLDGNLSPEGVYVYCQERLDLYTYIKQVFDEAIKEGV